MPTFEGTDVAGSPTVVSSAGLDCVGESADEIPLDLGVRERRRAGD